MSSLICSSESSSHTKVISLCSQYLYLWCSSWDRKPFAQQIICCLFRRISCKSLISSLCLICAMIFCRVMIICSVWTINNCFSPYLRGPYRTTFSMCRLNPSLVRSAFFMGMVNWWHCSTVHLVIERKYLILSIHISLYTTSASNLVREAMTSFPANFCVSSNL